jgi:hypothetical protein
MPGVHFQSSAFLRVPYLLYESVLTIKTTATKPKLN